MRVLLSDVDEGTGVGLFQLEAGWLGFIGSIVGGVAGCVVSR